MDEHDRPSFIDTYERIVIGTGAMAALITAITFAAYLLVGSSKFEQKLGPIGAALLVQFGGGLSVGLIGGALHRLATSAPRIVAIGLIAMLPYSAMAGRLVLGPFSEWSMKEFFVVAVVDIAFGGYGGIVLWREIRSGQNASGPVEGGDVDGG